MTDVRMHAQSRRKRKEEARRRTKDSAAKKASNDPLDDQHDAEGNDNEPEERSKAPTRLEKTAARQTSVLRQGQYWQEASETVLDAVNNAQRIDELKAQMEKVDRSKLFGKARAREELKKEELDLREAFLRREVSQEAMIENFKRIKFSSIAVKGPLVNDWGLKDAHYTDILSELASIKVQMEQGEFGA